jgi:RNA polymerase sigma factor (sigma-70 family)
MNRLSQQNALAGVLERLKASPADEDAWRSLYHQLWPFVIAVIYRRLRGSERKAAEDAAQEVFIRLLRSRAFDHIPDAEALRAYVWRIADNVAKAHLRRVRTEKGDERGLAEWRPSVEGHDGESALLARQVFELAEGMLEPKDRDLFRLILEGSSLGQAADQMGLSYSNAGVRLHRIRRRLFNLLNLQGEKDHKSDVKLPAPHGFYHRLTKSKTGT